MHIGPEEKNYAYLLFSDMKRILILFVCSLVLSHVAFAQGMSDQQVMQFIQREAQAGTKGNGGEIFVFDMGKPVRIADLAKRMIKLSGAKDVEIKYTGLRPGEKLYEEVLNELEGTKPTFHEKIRIAEVREYDYDQVCKDIDELIEISKQYDDMATVAKMKQIVPEYKSNNSVYEKLDK